MPSMLSTLLFKKPETVPIVRARTHYMDARNAPQESWHKKLGDWSNRPPAKEIVESVYAFIASNDNNTIKSISDGTKASETTVARAICRLESWESGPRIVRNTDQRPHLYIALNGDD